MVVTDRTKPGKPGETTYGGGRLHLSFYDEDTLKPLQLPPDALPEIELLNGDGTPWKTVAVILDKDTAKDSAPTYHIMVPALTVREAKQTAGRDTVDQESLEDIEIPCGTPPDAKPMLHASRFTKPVSIDCQSHQLVSVSTGFPSRQSSFTPTLAVALSRLEGSYSYRLRAYDQCIGDFIAHPEALLNDVRIELHEIEGPVAAEKTLARTASSYRGRTHTAVTRGGFAEITGLTFGQLYELRISSPPGYICANPPMQRLMVNCGSSAGSTVAFMPCGAFPIRSVIFVPQSCRGARLPNMLLQAGGHAASTDTNGIWNIPKDAGGIVHFQSPGKTFSPSHIDLTKEDAPFMFMVEVAEVSAGIAREQRHRFRFVDENGEPFSRRKLRLRSPRGHEQSVYTDETGFFEAEEGSRAWAEEDDYGLAVEDVLLLTTGTD